MHWFPKKNLKNDIVLFVENFKLTVWNENWATWVRLDSFLDDSEFAVAHAFWSKLFLQCTLKLLHRLRQVLERYKTVWWSTATNEKVVGKGKVMVAFIRTPWWAPKNACFSERILWNWASTRREWRLTYSLCIGTRTLIGSVEWS